MNFQMILFYAGAFVLALGLLVIVHELGHYMAARACGVKVLRFAIGFGRVIWSRRVGQDQTEWAVALLPLGGYVKMLDEREGEVAASELPRAFNRQTVGRRAFIVAAGPVANLLLAILVYWLVFMAGVTELKPRLGVPPQHTPAAEAGIAVGVTVRAVNGKAIVSWQDLRWEVMRQGMERSPLVLDAVTAQGNLVTYRVDNLRFSLAETEKDPLTPLGLVLLRPVLPAVIGQVMPGSAAALAGLKPGDRVLQIDDKKIHEWADVTAAIRAATGKPLMMQIDRTGQVLNVTAVPQMSGEGAARASRLGVAVREDVTAIGQMTTFVRYGVLESFTRAAMKTWDTAAMSLRMMGRMVTGDLSWKNLSGPVTIADYAGQTARMGLSYYLGFIALISISLGVLNLLPIPVLDGGHLMYYLAEFIKGEPLPERVLEVAQRVGFALLALLMIFAFYNDLNRLLIG
jgi:regulator of sigma E protease